MLDLFAIVTTGGIILWKYVPVSVNYQNIIAKVIQTAFIEATVQSTFILIDSFEVHWTICKELGLIFLAAYQKIFPLTYVPSLLKQVSSFFVKNYTSQLKDHPFEQITNFDTSFLQILRLVEEREEQERKRSSPARISKEKPKGKDKQGSSSFINATSEKKPRDWGDKVNEKVMESLDLSSDKRQQQETIIKSTNISSISPMMNNTGLDSNGMLLDFEYDNDNDEDDDDEESIKKSSGIWKYFESISGQKALTKDDLAGPISQMREHLIQKNVTANVADVICQSVTEKLMGKKTGTFNTIAKMIKSATETAVARILVPKASTDLLGEIQRAEKSSRPYVVAFVGVNGVGKSTNLSKVCFWLLQNNLKVLLVAGDTFRSGAVEQLRAHVRNLSSSRKVGDVELFERGYGKDAAAVARDAINYAKGGKFDVVMIDTAGRMQDNVPLMAALAKLVYVNQPDKLIFVGEALVGNEAVDQLTKFNAAFRDHAQDAKAIKQIDGILLTKFDTIDDKVGAALSMTFIANAPILFVGVGQTYLDLRKLDVKSVVMALSK